MASPGKKELGLDRQGPPQNAQEDEAAEETPASPLEQGSGPQEVGPYLQGEGQDEAEEPVRALGQGLTPREARRVRAITGAVFMACIAVALVVQLGHGQPSLLTIASYGVGLVLSGVAIKLSYRGRTRVASAVLVTGFLLAVVAERLLAVL